MAAVVKSQIRVRAMCPGDLATISAMEVASYEFPWSAGIFADCLKAGHSCWVLAVDGVTVGYGILSVGAGEAHVLNLCIDPTRRGQGLGRHLLLRLIGVAGWNHATRMFLEVRPSNPHAIALYTSVGFHEIGRRLRYYPARDGREDAIVMALEIAAGNPGK
ncbi:MAG TPA: ribosomal protein S18-alanine N-acetyltransferase [Rhodanobacter sp.]|jgi:ribosomal-protein-alanine N-acetyltransferase